MADRRNEKTTLGRVFWIVIAAIGSAWLVYSGLRGYIEYWMGYSFSNNFFRYLINPAAFNLVKVAAGCTFFAIMRRDLGPLGKGFSIVGMIFSMITAIFYMIGLFDSVKAAFFSGNVGTFIERITSASLLTYLAYSILLVGMMLFFIAGINQRRGGRAKRIVLIIGAVIVYALSLVRGIIDNSAVTLGIVFSHTFFDCLAYIAIAIAV